MAELLEACQGRERTPYSCILTLVDQEQKPKEKDLELVRNFPPTLVLDSSLKLSFWWIDLVVQASYKRGKYSLNDSFMVFYHVL